MRSLSILIVALFGVAAHAAGDAGCGLGSMIIQKNAKLSQLFAATTNHSFSSQAFGITFGTSGCSSSSIVMLDKEATHYAEANFENLKVDMARGEGENLSTFAQILGCKANSVSDFGQMTRAHYSDIVSSTTPSALIQSVQSQIGQDKNLSNQCKRQI